MLRLKLQLMSPWNSKALPKLFSLLRSKTNRKCQHRRDRISHKQSKYCYPVKFDILQLPAGVWTALYQDFWQHFLPFRAIPRCLHLSNISLWLFWIPEDNMSCTFVSSKILVGHKMSITIMMYFTWHISLWFLLVGLGTLFFRQQMKC